MGHANQVNQWVEDHKLWQWKQFRNDEGMPDLPSTYNAWPDEKRVEKVNQLQELLEAYEESRPGYKDTFIEKTAPDFGDGVSRREMGQRLFGTPQVMIVASSLSLRETMAPLPGDPFDITINIDNVPARIPIKSRDGGGISKKELKAAVIADQLGRIDADDFERIIIQEGHTTLKDVFDGLQSTLLEAKRAGEFRDAIANDLEQIYARNEERIVNALKETSVDDKQPFTSPGDWQSARQDHEDTINKTQTDDSVQKEYATVSDLDSLRDRIQQLGSLLAEGRGDTQAVEALEEDINSLWNKVEANSSDIDDLRSAHGELGVNIRRELQNLETAIDQGTSDSDLVDQIDNLERELQRLRNDTADALRNTRNTAIETEEQIDELEGVIDDLRDEIDEIQTDLQRADGDEVEGLLEEFEERKVLLAQLEERIDQWESEQAFLEARLESAGIDHAELEQLTDLTEARFCVLGRSTLTRFEESIKEPASLGLFNPESDESIDVPETYEWDEHRETGIRRVDALDDIEIGENSIINRYRAFKFTTPSGLLNLSQSTEVAFESVVYGRRSWFEAVGEEAPVPLTMESLVDFLEKAGYFTRAENAAYPRILCVVSPTGVSDNLRELLTSDQRWSRIHPNLHLCVADLQTGELVYDSRVRAIKRNVHLFEHYTADDHRTTCEEILDELENDHTTERITVTRLANEYDIPSAIALDTLMDFAAAERGELYDLDDMGVEFEFHP